MDAGWGGAQQGQGTRRPRHRGTGRARGGTAASTPLRVVPGPRRNSPTAQGNHWTPARPVLEELAWQSGPFAHRFELLPVQLAPVQQDGVDGVARPGGLDVRGRHVQQVLQRDVGQRGQSWWGPTGCPSTRRGGSTRAESAPQARSRPPPRCWKTNCCIRSSPLPVLLYFMDSREREKH